MRELIIDFIVAAHTATLNSFAGMLSKIHRIFSQHFYISTSRKTPMTNVMSRLKYFVCRRSFTTSIIENLNTQPK